MAAKKTVGYAKYRLSPLKKITDLAKQIRKQHPNMKYTDAVKKAGVQYRAGKTAKPAPKKKAAARKAVVKKVKVTKTARKKAPAAKQGQLFGKTSPNMIEVSIVGKRLNELTERIERTKNFAKGKPASERKILMAHVADLKKQFVALKKYFNTLARFKSTR